MTALADERRAAEAEDRFVLREVTDPDGPDFAATYAILDDYFGPRREIERRDILQGLLADARPFVSDGITVRYRLFGAWTRDGQLAGARDCFVTRDEPGRVVLIFLSHSLVLPPYRRSGLAAMFRTLPAELGRVEAQDGWEFGVGSSARARPPEVLIAAEMDPVDPARTETLVRLLAYGRAGYFAISPRDLPYLQPDFTWPGDASTPRPVPLMPVIRWLGHEDATEMPGRLAHAFDRHLHAVHDRYVPPPHIDQLRAFTQAVWTSPATVRVWPLPRGPWEWSRLQPLLRSAVLPVYTAEILGEPLPALDPAGDIERLARVELAPPGAL